MDKKAFTLIEMLVTIVIFGVILAIIIPFVTTIKYDNSEKMYQEHIDIVEEKMKLFISRYESELVSDGIPCFQINYQTLLNQGFITELDVHCTGIIITNVDSDDNFYPEYYLNCVDDNNNYLNKSDTIPTGCTLFTSNLR